MKTLLPGLAPVAGLFAASLLHAEMPAMSEQPNIVLILADDLGYGDLGCYGAESKVPTPNIDRLAAGGTRFTDAYCPVAVCSPSRYALLTGRYPWRTWKKAGVLANWHPPMIEEGRLTLPTLLKQAGYTTAGFGKWHLGANYTTTDGEPPVGLGKFKSENSGANIDLTRPITGGPLDRGFDEWYGFVCASEQIIFEGNRAVGLLDNENYKPPAAPGVDKLSRTPVSSYLPLITEKSIAYLDRRPKDKPFFLYMTPYVPHLPLAVEEGFRGKTNAGDYGDYVHELDHYVGRFLDELERRGLAEKTLVIFASDNGSHFEETGDGHRPNGKLRGTKHTVWEGGVRTPFIVRWPGRVPAGAVSGQVMALNDVLAACAALTGQELPANAGEDSCNMLPAWLGKDDGKPIREETVVQNAGYTFGLRRAEWKFVTGGNYKTGEPVRELYDLKADPSESVNLYDEKPALVRELKERLETILGEDRGLLR